MERRCRRSVPSFLSFSSSYFLFSSPTLFLEVGPLLRLGVWERLSCPSWSGRSQAAKRFLVHYRRTKAFSSVNSITMMISVCILTPPPPRSPGSTPMTNPATGMFRKLNLALPGGLKVCDCFQVIGRLIVGFAVSLSATAECIYIAEISPPVCMSFIDS